MTSKPFAIQLCVFLLPMSVSGCQGEPPLRTYRAVHRESSLNASSAVPAPSEKSMAAGDRTTQALMPSVDQDLPLQWTAPQGWTEEAGSGMRLATFRATNSQGSIECSIVSLAGQAGGLESNVVRWMNQIQAPVPDAGELKAFLDGQERLSTSDGKQLLLIDLTQLQDPPKTDAPAIIGAVLDLAETQVFVKMTGPRQAVIGEKARFVELCRSLQILRK